MLNWGLLGPEKLETKRRVRSLGIGSSVRIFNDLAVPGIGGIWFGRQLILPLIGIRLASLARKRGQVVSNIEAANAVEAIACLLSLASKYESSDARIKGRNKFQNIVDEFSTLSFSKVRKKSFYVTQPMRMASTTVLSSLGLVEPGESRFNSFVLSEKGNSLLDEAVSEYKPGKVDLIKYLNKWVSGVGVKLSSVTLRKALSPILPSSTITNSLIMESLKQGRDANDAKRRRAILDWVETLRHESSSVSWNHKPESISNEHWQDLQAGAAFFEVRDRALEILNCIESVIGSKDKRKFELSSQNINSDIEKSIKQTREAAEKYLAFKHIDPDALAFCQDLSSENDIDLISALIARDGNVLQLRGDTVVPAVAFSGEAYTLLIAGERDESDGDWPQGMSFRIKNMFLLNADLNGDLDRHLSQVEIGEVE